jgi:hypothetical protein
MKFCVHICVFYSSVDCLIVVKHDPKAYFSKSNVFMDISKWALVLSVNELSDYILQMTGTVKLSHTNSVNWT